MIRQRNVDNCDPLNVRVIAGVGKMRAGARHARWAVEGCEEWGEVRYDVAPCLSPPVSQLSQLIVVRWPGRARAGSPEGGRAESGGVWEWQWQYVLLTTSHIENDRGGWEWVEWAPPSSSSSSSGHITRYAVLPHCSLPSSALHTARTLAGVTGGLCNSNKLFFIKNFIFPFLDKAKTEEPFGQTIFFLFFFFKKKKY